MLQYDATLGLGYPKQIREGAYVLDDFCGFQEKVGDRHGLTAFLRIPSWCLTNASSAYHILLEASRCFVQHLGGDFLGAVVLRIALVVVQEATKLCLAILIVIILRLGLYTVVSDNSTWDTESSDLGSAVAITGKVAARLLTVCAPGRATQPTELVPTENAAHVHAALVLLDRRLAAGRNA